MPTNEETAKAAEWRMIAYVEVSLRRYASNWGIKQHRHAWHEVMLLNERVGMDADEGVEFGELLSGAPAAEEDYLRRAPLEEVLTDRNIHRAYLALPPRQQEVLLVLVLHGMNQAAVARRFNVTQQAICKAKKHALDQLRIAVSVSPGRHSVRTASSWCG